MPEWSAWQTIPLENVRCRFGCDEPIYGVFHIPSGCVCWPDPVQALCWQHTEKAQSNGAITALVWRPMLPAKREASNG